MQLGGHGPQDIVRAVEADHIIDLGQTGDGLGRDLGVTAGHDDPGRRILAFGATGELAALGVGLIGDRAAVDDIHVGHVGKRHQAVAGRAEPVSNRCRIVLVDFAAQGGQANSESD